MTPTAVTPAAKIKRAGSAASPKRSGPATTPKRAAPRPSSPHPSTPRGGHRTAAPQRSTAPRAPRRVSGPTRPARTAPSRPTPATPTRAPAARTTRTARRTRRQVDLPRRDRAVAALRTLPDHSLLDRVVRGRLWIPLLGVLLAGIVATQVEILKLNASIGQSVVRATTLQGENQSLRAEASRLGDDARIERAAAAMGMSMPAATQPLYVSGSQSSNLSRALSDIHAPDPTGFAAATSQRAATRAAQVTYSSGA